MDIIERIQKCAAEYQISTGFKPTRVYLGQTEMNILMRWAYENQYIGNKETQLREGEYRPEVG